jgi:electron transport complex protein RnfB
MTASNSYAALAKRLGYRADHTTVLSILEYLMTPEAARMVEALPGTPSEVSEKTSFPVDRVVREFDALFRKGVIFPRGDFNRREYYRFARSMNQLREATQASPDLHYIKDRKYFELWQTFLNGEMYREMGEIRRDLLVKSGASLFRIIPAYQSIEDLDGVLPFEDYREVLKAQDQIAIVTCPCRYLHTSIGEHCDHTNEEERSTCLMLGRGAEYSEVRGAGKLVTAEEAIERARQMEVDGLIHILRNHTSVQNLRISCNCCTDCCIDVLSVQSLGLPLSTVWAKSRFAAEMASIEACSGCQECVERCQFDAIEMVKVPGSKKMKAAVDEEKCYGCGLCVVGCTSGALKMKIIRPPEHIPPPSPAAH